MHKFLKIIFLVLVLSFISPDLVIAEPGDSSHEQHVNVRLKKKLEEKQEEQQKKDCELHPQACKINKNVSDIEDEFGSLADKYRSGEIWETGVKKEEGKMKYPLLKYPLMVPAYALKFATWPVAIVADWLIKKGVVRKVVDFVSNDARTFWVYPKVEMGFGSGFGGGIGMRHLDLFHKGYDLSAFYQIHINMNQEVQTRFKKNNAFYYKDKPFSFEIKSFYHRHHDMAFYGLGPSATKNDLATYGIDKEHTDGWLAYNFTTHAAALAFYGVEFDSTRHGGGGPDSVIYKYPRSELAGYGRQLVYMKFGLGIQHDNRNNLISPTRGGWRRFSFNRYQGLGTTKFDYNEYNLDIAQFIKVIDPSYVFILRGNMRYKHETGDVIPFFRLTRFDVDSPIRGYDYGRFTDRGRVVVNFEYRYPIWRFLQGTLFVDTGRVFHNPSDLSFNNWRAGGGGGLRLETDNYFLMRFEVAYAGEDVKLLVKTSQAF